MPANPAAITPEQLILEWAADLPVWVQDALRRGCQFGSILPQDESELYRMALIAHGMPVAEGETVPNSVPLAATHMSQALSTTDSYVVTGLKDVQQVNALASGQSLTFAPNGLTVIFGFNGSGKSGYSRLFKSACRAADDESIHRNIFAQPVGAQSAVFTVAAISDPDTAIAVSWTPTTTPDQLATLAFYDVRCARVLIDKDKEVAYSPMLLRAVDAVGAAVGNIVTRLGQESYAAQRPPNALLPITGLTETAVAVALGRIGPSNTNLAELAALRGLSETQQRVHAHAIAERQRLDAEDPVRIAATEERDAAAHQNRLRQAAELAAALSQESLTAIARLISDARSTAAAARQVMEDSSRACPLGGIGSNPWRDLYRAARIYSVEHAYQGREFPLTDEGSRCVLCQQPLTVEGKARYRAFDAVMQAEAEQLARAASERLAISVRELQNLPSRHLFDQWIERLSELDSETSTPAQEWLDDATARIQAMILSATSPEQSLPTPMPLFPVQRQVEALISAHQQRAEQARARIDPVSLAQQRSVLDSSIRNFTARRLLQEQWTTVENYALSLTRSKRLREASESITTTKVRRFQTKLAELMLTKRIADGVNAELTGLGFTGPRPMIKTSSSGGPAKQSLVFVDQNDEPIKGVRLPDVFSEGEQRVVSLALFLTEVTAAPGKPGIILDDPVCSMDDEWKSKIATRLAKEAGDRQVIIFTHSITFLQALTDSCAKLGRFIRTHAVQRIGRVTGHITDGQVWGALNVKARVGWLKNAIQEADALFKRDPSSIDYLSRLNLIADRVRATWERVVEEGMFSDAVVRFRKGVETKRIETTGLASSPRVFARVHWGMSEMSEITEAHDTTSEVGTPLIPPDEMRKWLADLEAVMALIVEEKKVSQKAMEAAIKAPKG